MDEVDLVALTVPEEVVHRLGGPRERDLDIVVPHQELAAGDLVALLRDPDRLEVPVRVRIGHPLLALDRLEVAELLDATGRGEVVEDRLVPDEALEAHYLLGQERAVVTELDVALARNVAAYLVRGHGRRLPPRRGGTPGSPASPLLQGGLDRRRWTEPAFRAVLHWFLASVRLPRGKAPLRRRIVLARAACGPVPAQDRRGPTVFLSTPTPSTSSSTTSPG